MKAKINMLILFLIVSGIAQFSTAMDPFEQHQFNTFIKNLEWEQEQINKQKLNDDLISAVRSSDINNVKKLLSQGADVNTESTLATCDKKGNIISRLTPLMWAAFNGNKAIVSLLLYEGAYSFITNKQGLTASDIANNNGYPEIAQFIEAH